MTATPPGWYPDGSGQLRYFDGDVWTDHTHPLLPTEAEPTPVAEQAPATDYSPVYESPGAEQAATAAAGEPAPGELDQPQQKPLYKRTWFIVTAAVVAILAIGALVTSGGSSDGDAPLSSPTVTAPIAPLVSPSSAGAAPTSSATSTATIAGSPAPSPSSTNKVDGDWELISFTAKKESFTGDFGGTGRIKYNGKDPDASNNFTVTLFKGGKQVASLLGPLPTIAPGQTKTVQFISTDKYVAGPYTIDFQKDL